jgi:hypothetical protein
VTPSIPIGERVLLTLWVGGLWAIGFIAAPILFAVIEDRALAGTLAGEMFRAMAWIGLLCGGLLLLFHKLTPGRPSWRLWVLAGMLLVILADRLLLAPMIADLRATGLSGSANFARLHGLASTLYLLNCLAGLALVAFGSSRGQSA